LTSNLVGMLLMFRSVIKMFNPNVPLAKLPSQKNMFPHTL